MHVRLFVTVFVGILFLTNCGKSETNHQQQLNTVYLKDSIPSNDTINSISLPLSKLELDTALYNTLSLRLVHNKPNNKFPVKAPYPLPGAILPFKRVVAYYGNFYSAGMGILGELSPDVMLEQLKTECKRWSYADTAIPVQPALEYIAVTAQRNPGKDATYRLRMPFSQINKALELCKKVNAILILDVQVGHCSLMQEIPALLPYLKMPEVHLAIDPEYSMKNGDVPCESIGTFDADDINYTTDYLAQIVRENHLPPKILIVHRFTKAMVTNYKNITKKPEVQIVMNMDGFGFPAKKIDTYKSWIAGEPVQFTGFKLFYKNDIKSAPYRLMTPAEILNLNPSPIYIQYQ
jgi:hypothetical protein